MNKDEILREIKRTAAANGGVPLGKKRFEAETGIRESDWTGRYWARWSEAVREAGCTANQFGRQSHDETQLLEKYAQLARELGQLPTGPDTRLKRRKEPSFPSTEAFTRRWTKSVLVEKVREHCRSRKGYEDVLRLCEDYLVCQRDLSKESVLPEERMGFVYLIKSGRFYKIGKTNDAGRRAYELSIQLPEKAKQVHVIRTDDPGGIEAYWHKRFEAKRKRGEWFELDAADVAAFKRRKSFM